EEHSASLPQQTDSKKGHPRTRMPLAGRDNDASAFTLLANFRHAMELNRSTGPVRSCVSRTMTRLPWLSATSTQPPFEALYLALRQFKASIFHLLFLEDLGFVSTVARPRASHRTRGQRALSGLDRCTRRP